MLNRGDILFSCAVAVALLVFVHIIWAEVCRRWKLGQARKEELEYLVRLAAEEAAREEMETTLAYVPASIESTGVEINGGNRGFECAVCRRATSSRCSRCKTVRYCSGTCQIIHWRRGHKDECCLSKADHQYMLKKSSSHHSGLQVETSQSLGDNDTEDIALLLDSSRRDISHGSLVDSSSSYSTYPVFSQNYEEASNWEGLHLRHHAKAGDALSCDIADDDGPKKAADANCIEIPLVRIGSASLLVKNLSQTNNSNKKLSSFCTKDSKHRNIGVELDAICTENPLKHSNQNRTLGTNSTYENSSANSLVGTTKPNLRNCRVVGPVKSSFFLPRKSVDEGIVKARRLRSVSISLADHAFYDGRRHSGFDDSFSKVNNAPIMTSEFSKSAGFASSSKSHLKTSVKNMVHRFKLKPSLSSRGLSSMPMNFSYELFAKLFNSDKVDMDPFGLFNCGNSCFANVVLQCLVFTRPLTAYLLEGFHRAKCSIEGWCFTCEFEHLIVKGKQGKSPLSSVRILSHIHRIGSHFAHGREEDAHEFLRYAIDAMQYTCVKETGDVANNFTEATNLIQLTFGGCLRSEVLPLLSLPIQFPTPPWPSYHLFLTRDYYVGIWM